MFGNLEGFVEGAHNEHYSALVQLRQPNVHLTQSKLFIYFKKSLLKQLSIFIKYLFIMIKFFLQMGNLADNQFFSEPIFNKFKKNNIVT